MMENFSPFDSDTINEWQGANFSPHEGQWNAYVWLMVLGSIAAFMASWGIGANDVANSFATSVGAKSITMLQACLIAAVLEFVGAVSLGGSVTSTVKGAITNPDGFREEPQIFAFGMFCAATAVAIVLFVATYFSVAVSTTHTVIGAVLGFGLVYGGSAAINWNKEKDDFPFRTGFTPVVISWFVSPIFTGIISSFLFILTRTFVLRMKNSYRIAFWVLPFLVAVTIFVILLSILLKGVSEEELDWDENQKAWVSAIVGAGCGLAAIPYAIHIRKKMFAEDAENERKYAADAEKANGTLPEGKDDKISLEQEFKEPTKTEVWLEKYKNTWMGKTKWSQDFIEALTYDVHAHVASLEDPTVARLHAEAEVFDPRTEDVFKHLQVVTASAVAFVHGANDVANGVGPLAGIWDVYNNYRSSSKAEQPRWILVIGALGIVFGLAMYGYKLIKTLGVDLVVMTPARGYCAELAAVVIIALATVYGLPVSTTQVMTGGEVGVGMCESWRMTGVNWWLFFRTFWGWVGALVLGALISALFFSIGVYGPSLTNMDYVIRYQNTMRFESTSSLNALIEHCENKGCAEDALECSCGVELTGHKMGDLLTLQKNLETLFDPKSGEVNQYNMIYMTRQIGGLFRRTFLPEVLGSEVSGFEPVIDEFTEFRDLKVFRSIIRSRTGGAEDNDDLFA